MALTGKCIHSYLYIYTSSDISACLLFLTGYDREDVCGSIRCLAAWGWCGRGELSSKTARRAVTFFLLRTFSGDIRPFKSLGNVSSERVGLAHKHGDEDWERAWETIRIKKDKQQNTKEWDCGVIISELQALRVSKTGSNSCQMAEEKYAKGTLITSKHFLLIAPHYMAFNNCISLNALRVLSHTSRFALFRAGRFVPNKIGAVPYGITSLYHVWNGVVTVTRTTNESRVNLLQRGGETPHRHFGRWTHFPDVGTAQKTVTFTRSWGTVEREGPRTLCWTAPREGSCP